MVDAERIRRPEAAPLHLRLRAVGAVSDDLGMTGGIEAIQAAMASVPGRTKRAGPVTDAPAVKHVKAVKSQDDDQNPAANWWTKSIGGSDLDAIDFPPVRYLHEPTGIQHGLILLAGPPKSGKSMLATGLAVAVAQDGNPFGSRDKVGISGEVLIISLDDASWRRAKQRLRALNDGQPIPAGIRLHTEHNLGRGKEAAGNLDRYLDKHPGTALVVIDTLEHLRPEHRPGASAYSDDVAYLGDFRKTAANHPATSILCTAHTRKGDDDDPIQAVGGTHGVTGGADSVLVLAAKRGAARRLLFAVSRDAEDRQTVLTLGPSGFTVTGEDPDDPFLLMSADDRRICEAVAEFPNGASAVELGALADMPDNIGNRLAKLARSGHLKKTARGVYSA